MNVQPLPPINPRSALWKGDTIIGKGHQGVFTTLIERKQDQKYTVLTKSNPNMPSHYKSILEAIIPYQNQIHTIT
jgi:transposase, IS30 family